MTEVFLYKNGALHVENVALAKIAAEVGTPVYVYSKARIEANYRMFADSFKDMKVKIFYAVKANPNLAVIHTLAACGAGADITSGGEMERALAAGVRPEAIAYSGVGKTSAEIEAALKHGIYQINIESVPEITAIDSVAAKLNTRATVTMRINPDVAARTYKKTSTGELGTKFGIDLSQLEDAMEVMAKTKHLDFRGFQVHIGSHVYDYEPFREAFQKLAELVVTWRKRGMKIDRLDLGGGVGIPYDGQTIAPFKDFAAIVHATAGDIDCELGFEPGRCLVGDAGLLLSRVVYDKAGASKRFLILDAGMNDLIRPAMYEARHSIMPVKEAKGAEDRLADVVGPVCETSDLFGVDYRLPGVGQGDLVAILQAGAYGAAMSSNYNGRALIPEVLVDGDTYTVVRRRITVTEQLGWEQPA